MAQKIVLRSFRGLLVKEDIASPETFILTAAQNTLANYSRGKVKNICGIPIDVLSQMLLSKEDTSTAIITFDSRLAVFHYYTTLLSPLIKPGDFTS